MRNENEINKMLGTMVVENKRIKIYNKWLNKKVDRIIKTDTSDR